MISSSKLSIKTGFLKIYHPNYLNKKISILFQKNTFFGYIFYRLLLCCMLQFTKTGGNMGFWDYLTAGLGLMEQEEQHSPRIRKPIIQKRKTAIDYEFNDRKIAIQEPVDFPDIVRFVKSLSGNVPLIVNFGSLRPENATRGLDFVCGAVCALGGKLQRIVEGIYFYAPKGVAVETDKKHKGKEYAY